MCSSVPARFHKTHRIALLLFLAMNFIYLVISSGRVRTIDEVSADFLTESLVTHGTTSVPQAVAAGLFYGKFDLKHRPQTPYGVGQGIFLSPWYVAGRLALCILPGIPPASNNFVLDATLAASNTTFAALAVALAFLLLISLGISIRNSLIAVFLLGFATPLFAYSTWLSRATPLPSANHRV